MKINIPTTTPIYLFITAILLLLPEKVSAQLIKETNRKFEVSIGAGGGMAGLQYNITGGTSNLRWGVQADFNMIYFFNNKFGIGTGAGIALYNSEASLTSGLTTALPAVDSDGNPFEWRTTLTGYSEKQQAYYLYVPLFAQYQLHLNPSIDLYMRGGAQLAFVVDDSYKAEALAIQTSGYYPFTNTWVTNNPSMGFGTISNYDSQGSLDLGMSVALSAEAGFKFYLSKAVVLYTGLYFNYGINSVQRKNSGSIIDYKESDINSYTSGNSAVNVQALVNNVNLLSYGVTVRIGLGVLREDNDCHCLY